MKNIKQIICLLAVFALIIPFVKACSNPIVYNEFNVPVSLYGSGYLTIDGDDYPEGLTKINYNLKIKNTNNQGLTFSLTPSGSLVGYVDPLNVELTALETKDFALGIYISSSKEGVLLVTGQCQNQMSMPEGTLGIKIYAAGDMPPGGSCKGNDLSCGTYPVCQDLTKLDGCYNGYYRNYYCSANVPKYSELCTGTCCRNFFGPQGYCSDTGVCKTTGNVPPVIDSYTPTNLNPTVEENQNLAFTQTSSDANGNTLTYSWLLNGTQKSTSQSWTYTPTQGSAGIYNVTFIVSDGIATDSQEWRVTVTQKSLLGSGQNCTQSSQCQSNYCVHGFCRQTSTYCGDTYCDSEETCSSCSSDCGTCSSGNSGSSGSSGSSGGTFGSSGGSVKSTDFYGFPTFVQVEAGKEATTQGNFYSKYLSDQTNIEFKISGIDVNWFTIEPYKVQKISYEQEVPIKITFKVPQNTKLGDYPFKLSTKIGTVNYEKTITLVVTASQATTNVTQTTTTLENINSLQSGEKSPATGLLTRVGDVAKKYWFVGAGLVILFLLWKIFPRLSLPSEESGDYTEVKEGSDYLEVKQVEKKIEPEKKEEPKVKKKPDEALIKAREKVVDEIRKKAIGMDKR